MLVKNNESPQDIILEQLKFLVLIDTRNDQEYLKVIRSKLGMGRLKLKLNGDKISTIQMLFVWAVLPSGKLQVPYLVISNKDATKQIFSFKHNNVVADLYSKMILWGATAEMVFSNLETICVTAANNEWLQKTKEEVYKKSLAETANFYSKVHQQMRNSLDKHLEGMHEKILVISVGCGDGQEFIHFINKSISVAGFDINPKNIAIAKNKFPQGDFIQGEIKDIATHIRGFKQRFSAQSPGNFSTVILFSGILQRTLLSGTYEACCHLQDCYSQVDLVMCSSILVPLISANIAKKVGFKAVLADIDFSLPNQKYKNVLYILTPQHAEQRRAYIIKQSNKRSVTKDENNIDLALSADPLQDLKLISTDRLKKTKQIDLSWTKLDSSQLPALIAFLNHNTPELKTILVANVEPWCKDFLSQVSGTLKLNCSINKRKDAINENELPFLTVRAARYLNFFVEGKMPNQLLCTVQPKDAEQEKTQNRC